MREVASALAEMQEERIPFLRIQVGAQHVVFGFAVARNLVVALVQSSPEFDESMT